MKVQTPQPGRLSVVAKRKQYALAWGQYRLELGKRTLIMGVLNVTPDSFSDGGKFFSEDAAVAQGVKMAAEGADIIDVGGESTRPFSDPVSAEDEIQRVVPVIKKLADQTSVPISIDTTKSEVARQALSAGAAIINDISALRFDPVLAGVAVEFDAPIILMHMLGNPKTMQVAPVYADLFGEICGFLEGAVHRAEDYGIPKARIVVDPGIGFGKTVEHNLLLIRSLHHFQSLDLPIIIGASRKAFIRKIIKDDQPDDIPPDLPVVETGTQAAVAAAVLNGAHIVRVHNVANTVTTIKMIDAIMNAAENKA
jgi:dihydropteroate synthase